MAPAFAPSEHLQRAALALFNGVLYVDRLRSRDDLHPVEREAEDGERETA